MTEIEPRKLAGIWGARQAGSMWDINAISPTIKTPSGGYSEPLIIENQAKEGDSMNEMTYNPTVKESEVKKPFKFVELFAGIGGVSFGFERVGGECVMAAEHDPQAKTQFAAKAYSILHPHVDLRGDVFELDASEVPDHDVLSFTTPCQSFSVAGKRGGFDDVRGTLYFEAMRIANEKKPKVIFMENVKGIVGHDGGKTLDTIVKVANECGYTVDFNVLNSKYFGVPQNRERFFMIGVRDDLIDREAWTVEGTNVVAKGKRRISGYPDVKTFNFDFPEQDEVTTRLRDILEGDVDDRYYLSEEKTEKLVEQLGEKDSDIKKIGWIERDRDQKRVHSTDGIMPTITANNQGGRSPGGLIADKNTEAIMGGGHREPKIAEVKSVGNTNPSGNGMNGQVYDIDAGLSPTLTTNKGEGAKLFEGVVSNGEEKERNTVKILRELQKEVGEETFTEWRSRILDTFQSSEILQSGLYEEIQSAELSTTIIGEQQQKECTVENQIFYRLRNLSDVWNGEEFRCSSHRQEPVQQFARELSIIMQELSQQSPRTGEIMRHLWEASEGTRVLQQALYKIQEIWRPVVQKTRYRIRKLSPLECFRLQGFPDSAHQALVDAGISNSQRYKQAGNAVTVNVIQAIGERLITYL